MNSTFNHTSVHVHVVHFKLCLPFFMHGRFEATKDVLDDVILCSSTLNKWHFYSLKAVEEFLITRLKHRTISEGC